jgi:predicted MPP superfamily phosphohydrolase
MPSLLVFLSIIILVYFGMQYYVAYWLIRNFPSIPIGLSALRIAVFLIALLFPFSIYLLRAYPGPFSEWFAYLTYIWTGASFILFTWALFGDCMVLLSRTIGAAERVRMPVAYGVLVATAVLSLQAFWNASRLPRIRTLELPIARLPKGMDGFTIVQLSDLHLGVTVPVGRFREIARQVNALRPDLIALTGDLLDPGAIDEAEVREIGRTLKARVAKIAVLGNHDFYYGAEAAVACFRGFDSVVLRNDVMELPGGLQIAGVDDTVTAGLTREDVSKVLKRLDPKKPSLFLSHQPRIFDLAVEHGVGLMLSGHTHQGQIFPFGFFVWMATRYLYGLYQKGDSFLYVTSGTGQWGPPMRLFTRSEIVRIVLRSPAASAVPQ